MTTTMNTRLRMLLAVGVVALVGGLFATWRLSRPKPVGVVPPITIDSVEPVYTRPVELSESLERVRAEIQERVSNVEGVRDPQLASQVVATLMAGHASTDAEPYIALVLQQGGVPSERVAGVATLCGIEGETDPRALWASLADRGLTWQQVRLSTQRSEPIVRWGQGAREGETGRRGMRSVFDQPGGMTLWNRAAAGESLSLSVYVEARMNNDKWYEVRLWLAYDEERSAWFILSADTGFAAPPMMVMV